MKSGFTLAELLIALTILGVLATFTIPKVLLSQQESEYKAKAKEAASMVEGALQAYKTQNTLSGSTRISDLTPYMNYVKFDTTSSITIDRPEGTAGTQTCASTATMSCLILHNGGVLVGERNRCFFGTTNLHTISMRFDPNIARSTTSASGAEKGIDFWLYYNGRITTQDGIESNTLRGNTACSGVEAPFNPDSSTIPTWFSWD